MSSKHLSLNDFRCLHCGLAVAAHAPGGTPRNHCPSCLHSRHVTDSADDGSADCRAPMAPISIAVVRGGEWILVHRCAHCQELTSAPVGGDDNQLLLMRLAVRPLAQPPFPLEAFSNL